MGTSRRWTARELIDLVLDDDSYESWDETVDISGHSEEYQAELRTAAEKAGTDESVLTGRGAVNGRPVAFIVNEFQFLAGSIGVAAAERIASAVRRATAAGIHAWLSPLPPEGASVIRYGTVAAEIAHHLRG